MHEQRVASVVTFHVSSANFDSICEEVNTTLQRRISTMPGLIEATVLTNEQSTRLIVVSTWESTQNWAVAQWDEGIDRTVADVFQKTASYDLELFSLLARLEPKH